MQPDKAIAGLLWDIVSFARETVDFVRDVGFDEYLEDRKLMLAVERQIELIGEASRRLPGDFKSEHPEVPWSAMVGQRNVLAHDYGEINSADVWNVATFKLPELIIALEPLLPPLEEWKESL